MSTALVSLLATCRRRGIDRLVLVAVLVGALAGPSAASAIAAVARQVSQCTTAHAINHTTKESA
ncbi:hypothetical protein [Bradyrhizobium sp. USDA 3364]